MSVIAGPVALSGASPKQSYHKQEIASSVACASTAGLDLRSPLRSHRPDVFRERGINIRRTL